MCQLPPDSQAATASQFSPLVFAGGLAPPPPLAGGAGRALVPTFSIFDTGAVRVLLDTRVLPTSFPSMKTTAYRTDAVPGLPSRTTVLWSSYMDASCCFVVE